ncbi:MAG: glycoside hydrolase family 2 TIM barrel-domain containing protein [Betaproteobacteria bacterium]
MAAHATPAAAREVEPLDAQWRFLRADAPAASQEAFDDSQWAAVTLPHTWNAIDGEAGGDYYRGAGWYRRELQLPSSSAPRRHYLQFDGAALVADVWVNGHAAGHHEGGYAAFRLDVSDWLHAGRNVIAVRVDNAPSAHVAPLGGDFTVFGGLYRGVQLLTVDPVHIDLLDDGGPGVYVTASDVSQRRARLTIRTRLVNTDATPRPLRLRWSLRDARARLLQRREAPLTAAPGSSTQTVEQELLVPHPRLWQGVRDPYLYTLSVEVVDGTSAIDRVTVPVGIRAFGIDPERGLSLNGRPYPVHGVNLFHSGRPGHGLAVGDAQVDEDFRLLQELGVTGLRLVHFQHPQRAYDGADRLGFVVWTEIPLNSAMDDSDEFRANLTQQLRELVKQNYNHPAVVVWGLGNEVYQSNPASHDLLARLHRTAKALDPQRPTSYAHCCAADDDPLTRQTDVIAYNRYYGWYDGEVTDIGPWADRVHALQPGRAMALSEYGAGASVLQQQDPPARPQPRSRWHPEQYQALFHEAYWRQLATRRYLWANFVWVGFDLASAGRDEGDRPGINDKGLATYDRRTRKDAWFWYQANWSPRPMVYVTNRRATPRSEGRADIKVYTNTDRVTLQVNGISLPAQAPRDRLAIWHDVPLRAGANRITATGPRGVADSIEWIVTPQLK